MAGRDAPLPPGATLGILGNGQLGRMLCLAAARLGYRTHVYGPEADSPAEQVATAATVAEYGDRPALAAFAAAVDVITFEFENVPADAAAFLVERRPVRPNGGALATAQDRASEKAFFARIGASTPPWRPVDTLDDLARALDDIAPPAVLKTARFGYDGKGQAKIGQASEAAKAWDAIGGNAPRREGTKPFAVLEGFVDFATEISVIAARGADGTTVAFDPAENLHRDHILARSSVPAAIAPEVAAEATRIARRAAEALDLVGLLAVEMFVTRDGKLLCNEMAPRPHNSGHWTMDGGGCDQFEMLVRAAMGLPLPAPARFAEVTMLNLIGDQVHDLARFHADPAARIHLYGKAEARPGRKMGHVNLVRPLRRP
jgi:5-(carboxyamino)imidazole ribonucleotide synthase